MKRVLMMAPMSSVHERFNRAAFRALSAVDADIHVLANFSASDHDRRYKDILRESATVYELPFCRGSLRKNLKTLPFYKDILKQGGFDAVHCHTETGGLLTRLAMGAACGTKFIYTPHGMSFYKGGPLKDRLVYKPVERYICMAMDKNIAVNREEFSVLKGWKPSAAEFIHGAGAQVDFDVAEDKKSLRKKLGLPRQGLMVLSVGELNDNKNHVTALAALSRLTGMSDFFYVICGEGPLSSKLKTLAARLKMQDRLYMPGYCYNVRDYFAAADLFVFPSRHEGMSFALLEAMAAGLPVVCSDIRGSREVIADGRGGYLCRPDDVQCYSARLKTLFCDRHIRNGMGQFNKTAVEPYKAANVERELAEIYGKTLYG